MQPGAGAGETKTVAALLDRSRAPGRYLSGTRRFPVARSGNERAHLEVSCGGRRMRSRLSRSRNTIAWRWLTVAAPPITTSTRTSPPCSRRLWVGPPTSFSTWAAVPVGTCADSPHSATQRSVWDGSGELVAMARAETDCEVLHQDFLTLDLPLAHFDGIFANASLFHVPRSELARVLRDLAATLKPEGVLFCSNPRGYNEDGWAGGRYGCFHELENLANVRHRRRIFGSCTTTTARRGCRGRSSRGSPRSGARARRREGDRGPGASVGGRCVYRAVHRGLDALGAPSPWSSTSETVG